MSSTRDGTTNTIRARRGQPVLNAVQVWLFNVLAPQSPEAGMWCMVLIFAVQDSVSPLGAASSGSYGYHELRAGARGYLRRGQHHDILHALGANPDYVDGVLRRALPWWRAEDKEVA